MAHEVTQQPVQLQALSDSSSFMSKNSVLQSHRSLNFLSPFTGEGTPANPYQIQNISDLKLLRDNVSNYDKHFILTNNLTFTSTDYVNNTLGNLSALN